MSEVLWLMVVAAALGWFERARRRAGGAPPADSRGRRRAAWGAGVLLALVGIPPLSSEASQHLWVETIQFSTIAFGAAPLVALAAPASLLPGRRGRSSRNGRAKPWLPPGAAGLAAFVAVTLGWRLPAALDATTRSRAWLAVEVVALVAGTWRFWADVAESPPHAPLAHPAHRVALGALGAWSVWIFAWIVGMSSGPFYPAFAARTGAAGSQELAVGLLWVTSAAALAPMIFTNLFRWLAKDQQLAEAETELYLDARRG